MVVAVAVVVLLLVLAIVVVLVALFLVVMVVVMVVPIRRPISYRPYTSLYGLPRSLLLSSLLLLPPDPITFHPK